jgi:hypothetical protein
MTDVFYSASVTQFLAESEEQIFGKLSQAASTVGGFQGTAWQEEIHLLKKALVGLNADDVVHLEFAVPRIGKRIDAVVLTQKAVLVLEFKVGASQFSGSDIDQVWDYALDLKNFHQSSHAAAILPILIATDAEAAGPQVLQAATDLVYRPVHSNADDLPALLDRARKELVGPSIERSTWASGQYRPTPTIIEAAAALYAGHGVAQISRSGAEEGNLTSTSNTLVRLVEDARRTGTKTICFVTGVPGAGKTLVGLNVATKLPDTDETHAVYLSGNGPLVEVLTEALARDEVSRSGGSRRKGDARRLVGKFIQSVHHYRDAHLRNLSPPFERVAIFDEAQRAWNFEQTAHFMRQRRDIPDFPFSEPEYLVSCMERHKGWSVIVCLVGGGQEINKGEVGIAEWLKATMAIPGKWRIYASSELAKAPYSINLEGRQGQEVHLEPDLHLNVSMRAFRANKLSHFIDALLRIDRAHAAMLLRETLVDYPIVLSRSVEKARVWLRERSRGTERPGLLVSSSALRLKPCALDVRAPIDPVHWFLAPKEDVRSSHYLEDAATEFQVQGLEIDWAGVVWDGDLRYSSDGVWQHMSFKGSKWENVHKPERQRYLENAYRVLLTRARQGMVIVVPEGSAKDVTRTPAFYDTTFEYLSGLGIPTVE